MNKPVLFLFNRKNRLRKNLASQVLMKACHALGYPVFVTDVTSLEAQGADDLFARVLAAPPGARAENESLLQMLKASPLQRIRLSELQAVIIRTSPGQDWQRAWAHRFALEVLRLASDAGVNVINSPAGLQRASSKLYSVCLPAQFIPRTRVCHSMEAVREFVEHLTDWFVIKPLVGSQGRDVFFLKRLDSPNTRQVVEMLGRHGYLMVQEYLPEASDGDIRVLTLDDDIIGDGLALRRSPAAGEMRSNVALGGAVSVVRLTDDQARVCREVAAILFRDGIRFAGIDLIGTRVVEVNVFSPGGLQELEPNGAGQLAQAIIRRLLREA